MGITGGVQIEGLLYACGLGFLIGVVYELFRSFREISPPSRTVCFVQDILFCLVSALLMFFAFLMISDGKIYPYLLVGTLVGFFVFYCTVGRWLHKLIAVVWKRAVFVFKGFCRILFYPAKVGFSFVAGLCRGFFNRVKPRMQKILKKPGFFSKKS